MENTMSKREFLKDHIVWGMFLFLFGFKYTFTSFPGFTYKQSLYHCVMIIVGILVLGIASTWKRERNYYSLIMNIWISWSVLFIIFYGQEYRKKTLAVIIITTVVTVGMLILIFSRRIKNPRKRNRIIRRRIIRAIACIRRNILVASYILMVPLCLFGLKKNDTAENVLSVERVYGEEHRLEANIEVISGIHPDLWKNMDKDQRLEIGQKILNCEARYLGLTNEITLVSGELTDETRGYYSSKDHQIVISEKHLSKASGYDVLETILHECYHAYQFELVRVYQQLDSKSRGLKLFDHASVYLDEFRDYIKGQDDFYGYYSQTVEADARRQSQTEMQEYISSVEKYVRQKNAG